MCTKLKMESETTNSSFFFNGGSNSDSEPKFSYLSLLMSDDETHHPAVETKPQTQTEKAPKYEVELPPLPSSYDETETETTETDDFLYLTLPQFYPVVHPTTFVTPSTQPQQQEQQFFSPESPYPSPKRARKEYQTHQQQSRTMRMRERVEYLHKLLPQGKDPSNRCVMANVLEDAYKYIKFLQAQVLALKAMPVVTREYAGVVAFGPLGWLSRQQLLQVVVNSSAVQSVMADKGWCVVSAEQLLLIKKIEARKKLLHQLLLNIPL